jgi:chromosome segregation ATPase
MRDPNEFSGTCPTCGQTYRKPQAVIPATSPSCDSEELAAIRARAIDDDTDTQVFSDRDTLLGMMDDLNDELDLRTTQRSEHRRERDALAKEANHLNERVGIELKFSTTLSLERDELRAKLGEAENERDKLSARVDTADRRLLESMERENVFSGAIGELSEKLAKVEKLWAEQTIMRCDETQRAEAAGARIRILEAYLVAHFGSSDI